MCGDWGRIRWLEILIFMDRIFQWPEVLILQYLEEKIHLLIKRRKEKQDSTTKYRLIVHMLGSIIVAIFFYIFDQSWLTWFRTKLIRHVNKNGGSIVMKVISSSIKWWFTAGVHAINWLTLFELRRRTLGHSKESLLYLSLGPCRLFSRVFRACAHVNISINWVGGQVLIISMSNYVTRFRWRLVAISLRKHK